MADNQYISPFVSNGDTFRSANKTSYDLTNTQPAGGPINDPESGFTHTYTPNNKYLDSFDVRASNNSNFGVTGTTNRYADVENNSIFEKTELDIEDPRPLGGVNRTNIPQIPGGIYTTAKTSNIHGENPFPGGILMNQDGTAYKVMVQRWNKSSTYLDSMRSEALNLPDELQSVSTNPANLSSAAQNDLNAAGIIAQGGTNAIGNLPIP